MLASSPCESVPWIAAYRPLAWTQENPSDVALAGLEVETKRYPPSAISAIKVSGTRIQQTAASIIETLDVEKQAAWTPSR
jgi:hypothetical protein